MRIADCGMRIGKNTIPKSEIPNPKFEWPMLSRSERDESPWLPGPTTVEGKSQSEGKGLHAR